MAHFHFDPFDNLMLPMRFLSFFSFFFSPNTTFSLSFSGDKLFRILPPGHPSLREGHVREAKFAHQFLEQEDGRLEVSLQRGELLESTSRVHSPSLCLGTGESLLQHIREEEAMVCHVKEGDVLFLPSYFWHEVESSVLTMEDEQAHDHHVAMNLWMPPLFEKETFPCEECSQRFNKRYACLFS